MKFQPGHKLAKGRKVGSKNKDILGLRDIITKGLRDPLEVLAELCDDTDKNIRLAAAKALAPYKYPQLRSVVVQGDKDKPFESQSRIAPETLSKITDLVKAIVQDGKDS